MKAAALVLLCSGCSLIVNDDVRSGAVDDAGNPIFDAATGLLDASPAIDASMPERPCDPNTPFAASVAVTFDNLALPLEAQGAPTLSSSMNEMYFTVVTQGTFPQTPELYRAVPAPSGNLNEWTQAAAVAVGINNVESPELDVGGTVLHFAIGGIIYRSTRGGLAEAFTSSQPNTDANQYPNPSLPPVFNATGEHLVFPTANGGGSVTEEHRLRYRCNSLSQVCPANDNLVLEQLSNQQGDLTGPWLSHDALRLYFTQTENTDIRALYVTRPTTLSAFSSPLNVPVDELDMGKVSQMWLSPDECSLFFQDESAKLRVARRTPPPI